MIARNFHPSFELTLKRYLLDALPYTLLVVLAIPLLSINLNTYPAIWFDEGYKTHAARLMAETGFYGSCTVDGCIPFDPGISSGPADIGAIALSFRLFGVGIWQARLPSLFFTLLTIVSLYAIARRMYGRYGALIGMLTLMAFPPVSGISFLLIGRQALGEMPALALICTGLWLWFSSWETLHWRKTKVILSGILLGLGLLSKTQIAIALLPTIAIVALGRVLFRQERVINAYIPLAGTMGIVVGWSLLGRFFTPEAIRNENAAMLSDAIRSNLITDLFGQNLTRAGWIIISIMVVGIVRSIWRIRPYIHQRLLDPRHWVEITMVGITINTMIWYAIFSIGWPRYAFVGLTLGLILSGTLIWSIARNLWHFLSLRIPALSPYLALTLSIPLIVAVVAINGYAIATGSQEHRAEEAAMYITRAIPRDAIIESWEWELDSLTEHRRFHHPHQRYLFLAIRQFSHGQQPFDLGYNILQADPDYLITGPYSSWTNIYRAEEIERHFEKVAKIGVYRVYRRIQ